MMEDANRTTNLGRIELEWSCEKRIEDSHH
ncbi:hypothetical protein CAEBREN_05634 [Caenorhabditis brenneri]|uniref:Uncharacterized protein n=1 Tax=Caenorhabditis brenneri TaxID=135651 RepID=G0NK16_CAEBE|nr:hypothetical protein CAEBREN_05634 [Caenorhabditis brenneri]